MTRESELRGLLGWHDATGKWPTKAYSINLWDTFEKPGEDTFIVDEADTLEEAEAKVQERFGDSLKPNGADFVEIVHVATGSVVKRYSVG